ncbi:MAG: entericidin [Akkermansiaceae bacterium]|nr:entericidin [Akkermansiaceae bacterium]
MKKICSSLLLLVSLLSLSSCNTFIGLGRDIERLGEGMQNKADGKTWSGNQSQAPADSPY